MTSPTRWNPPSRVSFTAQHLHYRTTREGQTRPSLANFLVAPSKPASMPPKEEKPQVVACFAPGKGQLGSVGMGFMEAYAELSESIIDVDSGEKMEAYLDKKQLVNGVQRLRRRQNAPPHVLPHVPPRTRRRTPQALLLSAADALNDDTALLLSHACPMSLDIVPWSFTRRRH